MRKNENGFGAIEILLVIAVIALIGVVGWQFFSRQSTETGDNTTNSEQAKESEDAAETTIRPSVDTETGMSEPSKDLSFTVKLPEGWSVENTDQAYEIVKTFGDDKYVISSSIEGGDSPNGDRHLMEQRVAEGVETVTSVRTNSGTEVSVLKTATSLFLGSCKPTSEECYLQLNGKNLYISVHKVVAGAQGLVNTDYPKEVVSDFESIARSLNF